MKRTASAEKRSSGSGMWIRKRKPRRGPAPRFVVCIENAGYTASLELHKIYRILPDADAARDGDVRIVDESGEDYLYPAEWFAAVELPRRVSRTSTQSRRRVSRTPGEWRSSAGWQSWTRARCSRFRGKSFEHACIAAEWRRPPSGFTPPPRRKRKRRMNGTPPEILTWPMAFARSYGMPSMRWRRVRGLGLARDAVPDGMSFRGFPSVLCTSSGATTLRSLLWLTQSDGLATGARGSDRPSNIRIQRSALRAAAEPGRSAS
jgi:hypothetical protein